MDIGGLMLIRVFRIRLFQRPVEPSNLLRPIQFYQLHLVLQCGRDIFDLLVIGSQIGQT